jgi:hypothetical protein
VTSNNWSVRKMGAAAWRKLHKLVYPAAVLGALHYVWLAKGFQLEPLALHGGDSGAARAAPAPGESPDSRLSPWNSVLSPHIWG